MKKGILILCILLFSVTMLAVSQDVDVGENDVQVEMQSDVTVSGIIINNSIVLVQLKSVIPVSDEGVNIVTESIIKTKKKIVIIKPTRIGFSSGGLAG